MAQINYLDFLTIYTKQGELIIFAEMQQYCPALKLLSKTLFVTSKNHRKNVTIRVGILRIGSKKETKKTKARPLKDGDAVQSTFYETNQSSTL